MIDLLAENNLIIRGQATEYIFEFILIRTVCLIVFGFLVEFYKIGMDNRIRFFSYNCSKECISFPLNTIENNSVSSFLELNVRT